MLVYCGQTIGWIKVPLGVEVGLGPGHIALDGDPAPASQKGGTAPDYWPMSIVAKQSPISATDELLLHFVHSSSMRTQSNDSCRPELQDCHHAGASNLRRRSTCGEVLVWWATLDYYAVAVSDQSLLACWQELELIANGSEDFRDLPKFCSSAFGLERSNNYKCQNCIVIRNCIHYYEWIEYKTSAVSRWATL